MICFLAFLIQKELLLYLFLILVSDRYGLSFYGFDAICSSLQLTLDQYIEARDGLMEKSLIAFNGTIFQILYCAKVRQCNCRAAHQTITKSLELSSE